MFVFVNSLYYSIVLLISIIRILFFLVSNSFINTLTIIIFLIIYIGAIIVLIGYVCAVSPNIITSPSFSYLSILLLLPLLVTSPSFSYFSLNLSNYSIVDYFYRSYGFSLFFLVIFILFLILILVTSQYVIPSGPFRSTSK